MINNRLAKTLAKIEEMSANEFKALMDRAGSKEPVYYEVESSVVSKSNFLGKMTFQSGAFNTSSLRVSCSNELDIRVQSRVHDTVHYNVSKRTPLICGNDDNYSCSLETAA